MKYPLITEYVEAVRSAAENLDDHDPLLASLSPVVQEGRPFYSSGNYAVVFKMQAPDGRRYAMKCWHKEMPGRDERYDLIAEELDSVQSSYLLGVRYCAEGLFVDSATADGELFPVLLMDWVDGTPLDAYLRTHRHDGYALGMVAYRFGLMAQWLMGQSFAHGDLKPDNILVRPDGTLVLVDYDGMFVPAMRGMAALECGTPNFRHPARTAQQFDDHTDDFTLAHIAAALKAVALQPALLDAMPQDALLFTDDDFRDLARSPVLSTLQALLADAEMARLMGLLLIAHAEGSLSQPMQPLFRLARPQKVEEVLSTKVTDEDLANAIKDEYGVKYSPDGKRLLEGNVNLKVYQVRPGTKVICDRAFEWCNSLQSITLPDSVTHIGDSAFNWCNSLQSITLPDSVTHIGVGAFKWCKSLQSITLPDSVTHIGDFAFSRCNSLQSITLPDSVTHIGSNPFWNSGIKKIISRSVHFKVQDSCLYNADGTHLITYFGREKSVTLPDSVTHIGDHAFAECYSLVSITLPDSVTHIGDHAFAECYSLVSITLPDSVTHIGNHAFYVCSSLQSITLPESVTHIGDCAFEECESLQAISLPESVTHIGDSAFYGCDSLQSITLPDSVTHIGDCAFWGCESLQSITLPESVTHIGDSAFWRCKSLQSITLPDSVTHIGSNPFGDSGIKEIISHSVHFKVQDSCLYNADGTHLISYFGREKSITLPDSVTHIGDSAFNGCNSLQFITLPDSVTHIGDSAFWGCVSLQSITLPDSVTHIGDIAFERCYSLQSITLPDSVTHIGDSAFGWCESLQSITLPDSVTHIGDIAFERCYSLQSITLPDSVTHIGTNPFVRSGIKEIISHSVHFKVQDSCLYNADGTHLISYFGREKSVTLPDSVTHIGKSAFEECESLQSITLPDSVTHIGDSAFDGCDSLQSITLPDSVTHIGNRAFEWCESLQRIVVPKGCGEKYRKMLPGYETEIVEES